MNRTKTLWLLMLAMMISYGVELQAADGYRIEVKIDNYESSEIYLGYHYGDKQYIKDTVSLQENGLYLIEGEESLDPGVYLVILPPDNNYFQLLISEKEQRFSVTTNGEKPVESIQVNNSPDNERFYAYLDFLSGQRPKAQKLNEQIQEARDDQAKVDQLKADLAKINEDVKKRQQELVDKYPNSLTAMIIKSSTDIPAPDLPADLSEEDRNFQRWQYYKKHWFDNLDMKDARLLRSPVMFQKVDHYINKLIVQHPDTIIQGVDYILDLVKDSEDNFKFYLIHFLNTYAKSKVVGMDAIYVHIAEKYYATGLAPWTEEEQLAKITKNARSLKPLLIGKTAPDIKVQKQDGSLLGLHEIKSDYTVLFFWDPDCGHCKKSMPDLLKFYDDYKSKGVEVFAVCTKLGKDAPKCWEMVKEKEMERWINVYDPQMRSRFKILYDIKSTPQVYVLDKDKVIQSKRIGAE
ncbi:MAG: redoxin domain-containing protein, partial [Bacteroidota bacterium]